MKESLKYFVGKVCTISTVQINFRYNVEQMLDYFAGIIEEIDDHGILMYHPLTRCKNYILFQYVVSISEEQFLREDNPEHKKIIDEHRKEKPITSAKRTLSPESNFINPGEMAKIAKQAKEAMLKPTS